MIGFDNGPRDGDYVRYIDDLMRQAAAASAATAVGDVAMLDGTRERTSSPRVVGDASRLTGFVTPTEAGKASAAAAAIASALMSGEIGRRMALTARQKIGLAAIAVGIVFALAGLLWQPFNPLPLVVGVAIVAWAVRLLRDTAARSGPLRRPPGG